MKYPESLETIIPLEDVRVLCISKSLDLSDDQIVTQLMKDEEIINDEITESVGRIIYKHLKDLDPDHAEVLSSSEEDEEEDDDYVLIETEDFDD